jgi:di/tricarboxylate transporter
MFIVDPVWLMWATFALIAGALVLYATEKLPMEVTSVGVVCVLLVMFDIFPVIDDDGEPILDAVHFLEGFANPALLTVLALLIMGQGMVRAGVLEIGARWVLKVGRKQPIYSVILALVAAAGISGFLNNIPVVVIFIPIMQALAERMKQAPSKLMIPLSYAAVIGGMTTLVGSSTNLLVNSAMIQYGIEPFDFFDFTIPGLVMAATGLLYIILIAPRLLPSRKSYADAFLPASGKQFIAQFALAPDSPIIGKSSSGGLFAPLPDMTLRMVQRDEEAILPPFENYTAKVGDILVVAATRKALTEAITKDGGLIGPDMSKDLLQNSDNEQESRGKGNAGGRQNAEQVIAEVMVAPASRLIGQTMRQIAFHHQTRCVVLGVQRRARMIRAKMTEIRLEAGDVLLVQGVGGDVEALKNNRDVILIAWTRENMPKPVNPWPAALIFMAVMVVSATGLIPIVTAALTGAVAMIALGVLTETQAARAVDPKIVATIGAALALGRAMDATGGAAFIAEWLVYAFADAGSVVLLSLFFLTVAILANLISTKTTAVLFTPIALDIAMETGVPPEAFAVAVVFAANCSFASPIGYQTNLLVLGPGHYRFTDFARAGIPLMLVLWVAFTIFAPWWYGF